MDKEENERMLSKLENDVIILRRFSKNKRRQYKILKYMNKASNKHKSNNKRLNNKRVKLLRLYEEHKTLHKVFMENNLA